MCVCVCPCDWVCLWWWAMLIRRECVRLRNERLCVWCVVWCVCVCVSVSVLSMWVCVFVYVSEWVRVFVMMSHVDKAWICSTEEFLELYGKVVAVVRNCLLRLSGQLFEVRSTHLFDKCFRFKHIRLFYAPIGAFFRWYPPFLYYTKHFTCRIGVTLNPCISVMNLNF